MYFVVFNGSFFYFLNNTAVKYNLQRLCFDVLEIERCFA